MKTLFLVVLALLCGNAMCVKYQADITITNDPYMPNAKIRATLYYQRESNKHTAFFHYPDFGMDEFINYTELKRLIHCTACESETISSVDRLDLDSAKKESETDKEGCTKYTQTGNTVKEIWAKSVSGVTQICKAVFTNGKIFTYSNFGTNPPAAYLSENSNWKCPQPVCTKLVDIVMVLDDSGSIGGSYGSTVRRSVWNSALGKYEYITDYSDWHKMVEFAKSVIDSFDPNTARFGLVTFAQSAQGKSAMTNDGSSLKNILEKHSRARGTTCIGCGINIANGYFQSARADATKVMIVFSDGYNNVGSYTSPASTAKSRGITIVTVGIGGVSDSQMKAIASEDADGKDLYIKAQNFADLKNILSKLVTETCRAAPDTYKSCGSGCSGFCKCGQQCVCPTCEASDMCTKHACSASNAGGGCKKSTTQCFKDICHKDVCNPKSGCDNGPIDCSHMIKKECHEAGCNPSKGGCVTILNASKCKPKPCHSVECTMDHGCVYTPLCQERNCQNLECVNNKCVYTPRPCKETDTMCIRYKCNPATNKCVSEDIEHPRRPCYNMTCDHAIGPVYSLYNCSGSAGNCEQIYCDPASDECKKGRITDCDVCENMDCSHLTDKCRKGKCIKDENGNAKCIHEETVDCSAPCAEGLVCNSATGNCDKDPNRYVDWCAEDTKDNECMESRCDIGKKECVNTTRTSCDDRLPCYNGRCKAGSRKCEYEAVCPDKPCKNTICTPKIDGGEAECTYENRTCSPDPNTDFNPECEAMVCNEGTDKCELISNCNPCKDVTCEDGDPCTDDECVVENGEAKCKFTAKCPQSDDYCSPIVCNIFGNCVVEPRSCRHIDVSGKEQSCYKVECDSSAKECRKVVIEGAFTDVCGKCIQSFGDNETELKEKQEDTTCIGALRVEEFAAALTGAAIAGIIIACVVVAAIIATAGYFGTKELIRRAKMAQDQSANNNPLYEGNANEMSNPSYAGAE